jgi:cellulose synthase (UDP-forming)
MWSFSFKVLLVLLAVVAALWLTVSRVASTKEALADRELLERLWQHYKKHYIDDAGFVLDRQQQRITSEGQSYALLRAAWMRDRATFDRVLVWTEAHLKRPDGLYSWLFSPVEQRLLDANTATDADQDIAYALIIAAQAFRTPGYLERAREIVKAVRTVQPLPGMSLASTAGSQPRATGPTMSVSSISPISYPTPIPRLTNSTPRGSGSRWSTPAMISWRASLPPRE